MVSKEYIEFFQKYYRDSRLQTNGLTPEQERSQRGKASTYLSRTKEQMTEDIDALITLSSLLPEKHLAEVLTEEKVGHLVDALLTQSINKSRRKDPHLQDMIDREYEIAAVLVERSTIKCLDRVQEAYRPWIGHDLRGLVAMLTTAAAGRQTRIVIEPGKPPDPADRRTRSSAFQLSGPVKRESKRGRDPHQHNS